MLTSVELLRAAWTWRPIPNCPGRLTLASGPTPVAPRDLVGPEIQLEEFRVSTARDAVVVGRFADGGLISYKRANGTYVHTLNTVDGFQRKLSQLGITLTGTA